MAVEAMRIGAFNFLEKPFNPDKMTELAKKATMNRRLTLDSRALRRELSDGTTIMKKLIGTSPVMERLREDILDLGQADGHVLIDGETGTGKTLVAHALHAVGAKAGKKFVLVSCAAFDEESLGKKIFGPVEEGAGLPVRDGVAAEVCTRLRSMTGLRVILVWESAHQSLSWPSRTRRWPSSRRPVGPKTVASPSVWAVKWAWRTTSRAIGEPVVVLGPGWPWARRSSAVWVRARSPSAWARRALRESADPSAFCTAAPGEGTVEVEGIGEVELGLDVQGAGVVDVVGVDRRMAGVD